ncbi:MAG: type II secretion system protein GspD [Gallionellales bacterium RIFCSPLOWO2_12_FULL_59_22]|nr:MAG: type II secretion system protein GspD [Gallionellales bacterium RIFCSPLOWO2_02_FULL_59_110]OGT01484.1 MAG: type II secretion system protein GspD [Gallionellales bacterium RIFCSPLOWO2_02_58_13]OGT14713.1 MAG: type II secretion system protein GspD [Gallionellales bacterium RIFCSPLOWO2_12_FULL_59_22]
MTKNRLVAWRCRSAAFVLLCAMAGVQQAQAQNNVTNEPTPASKGTLNFVDADIESVVAAIGDYTNTTFIIDPRIKGKINLVSAKPLTKAEALQLLSSVLRLQGYTVTTGNGYAKVVLETDAKIQGGLLQAEAVRGDQIATQIFRLNHESAASLVTVLRPLISPNNAITANVGSNALVITDYASNLLRLGKIIAALDDPSSINPEVVPIRHAIASDIAAMAGRLLEQGVGRGEAGRINLLADSRTNSVVVSAPSEARANLAKTLLEKLDQPTAQPGNVHVVYLKNAEAAKLAETLRTVMSADASVTTGAPASAGSAPGSAAASAKVQSGGAGGFIQADPTTNALIITASEPVYRNLRAVIDQLDARRAQVYIESLIVEVTAGKAAELGVQWVGVSGDSNSKYRIGALTGFNAGGNNLINQAAAKLSGGTPTPPSNGLSIALFNQSGMGALAHALETDSGANILSMPNLITLDNEEAKIIVGKNVPFITGQYTTASSGGGAGVNPFQTVERKDIGLTLRVKPQISQGGTVRMSIYQENSDIFDSSNSAGLITSKRSLDTNVLVDDGQIIVLGGLIEDNMQDGVEKVPGLGDIPLIGSLFQYKKRSQTKTNLMVFLRPTIVRSNEQSVNLAMDRYDYIRDVEVSKQPERTIVLPNMDAPLLPKLQNGQIPGGLLFNRMDSGSLFNKAGAANLPSAQNPAPQEPAPQQPALTPSNE